MPNHFANPVVAREATLLTSAGHELHAFTSLPLDCLDGYFFEPAREGLEAEALWLADCSAFDVVVLHQV